MFIAPLQVVVNGLFSFGRRVTYFDPILFPGHTTNYTYLVAPFWADHDTRPSGQVSYEVHYSNALTSHVSQFISQQQMSNFTATWMLIAEWEGIQQYQSFGGVSCNLKFK